MRRQFKKPRVGESSVDHAPYRGQNEYNNRLSNVVKIYMTIFIYFINNDALSDPQKVA